jgi:hypothetical protein
MINVQFQDLEQFVRWRTGAPACALTVSDTTRKEKVMRKFIAVLAAAAALGVAAPASAQVYFGAGPGGVELGVGDGYRGYRGYGHRHWGDGPRWRGGAYAWGRCRVIRERIVRPNGRVVVRTREVC